MIYQGIKEYDKALEYFIPCLDYHAATEKCDTVHNRLIEYWQQLRAAMLAFLKDQIVQEQ